MTSARQKVREDVVVGEVPRLVATLFDPFRIVGGKKVSWRSVPVVADPAWPDYCEALLLWIAESPRTTDEVVVWGREKAKDLAFEIRSRLAWLSLTGQVEHDGRRWSATGKICHEIVARFDSRLLRRLV